jgi:hypothetical protein
MSSPAIRRATTKSSASQPRFGLVMHPRRVFPLFATDPCFAALGRCAPVSLILPGLAELYFQSNDRLPVKTMSISEFVAFVEGAVGTSVAAGEGEDAVGAGDRADENVGRASVRASQS